LACGSWWLTLGLRHLPVYVLLWELLIYLLLRQSAIFVGGPGLDLNGGQAIGLTVGN